MTIQVSSARRLVRSAHYRFNKWVEVPFLRVPSRLWYGNDAGWSHNRQGPAEIGRLREKLGPSAPTAQDSRATTLKAEGYLPVPLACGKTLLQTITTKVHRLMEDPATSYPMADGNVCTRILGFLDHVPEARHFLTDEIANLLQAYYGTFFKVWSVTCWRIKPVPGYDGREEAYSNFWHCDAAPTYIMKLFVNLSDVTPETGAFRLHSIPSTREIMRSGYLSRWWIIGRARRLIEDSARVVYAAGPVGSAILCNTELCLHRAAIPRPGSYRDIIEFKFEPFDKPLPSGWWRHLDPDATEQRELARRHRASHQAIDIH